MRGVNFILVLGILLVFVGEVRAEDRRSRQLAFAPGEQPAGKIYRPNDHRVPHDDARAAALGIRRYESRHLLLYTDIDPAIAATLPQLIDDVYPHWERYFGKLPPARDGSEYQITGYLMKDQNRFVEAGMQPTGFIMARFGRQIGLEIWMNEQPSDYYRRHLLIHECTHAFMTTLPKVLPPLWYLEGMAEYFSTHTLNQQGQPTFELLPDLTTNFPNLGRIETIREQIHLGKAVTLSQIGQFSASDFVRPKPIPYAWCWAICTFLERHPRYHDRFREVAQDLEFSAFQRRMTELFERDSELLSAEWDDFIHRLDYNYDVPGNAFVPHTPVPWSGEKPQQLDVNAKAGWKSTGLHVAAGTKLEITAEGRVLLDPTTPRLESEPQGITVAYAAGFPVGTLLGAWLPTSVSPADPGGTRLHVFPVGTASETTLPENAELWFRVNDLGSDVANNSGSYHVTIRKRSEGLR